MLKHRLANISTRTQAVAAAYVEKVCTNATYSSGSLTARVRRILSQPRTRWVSRQLHKKALLESRYTHKRPRTYVVPMRVAKDKIYRQLVSLWASLAVLCAHTVILYQRKHWPSASSENGLDKHTAIAGSIPRCLTTCGFIPESASGNMLAKSGH